MSDKEVFLTEQLRNKLLSTTNSESGFVIGSHNQSSFCMTDCAINPKYFIHGFQVLGYVFFFDAHPESEESLLSACKEKLSRLDEQKLYDTCLVILPVMHEGVLKRSIQAKQLSFYHDSIKDLKISEKPLDLSSLLLFRASGSLPLIFEGSADKDIQTENLNNAINKLEFTFSSGLHVFYSSAANKVMMRSEEDESITCKQFVKSLQEQDSNEKPKKNKKLEFQEKIPVNLEILLQATSKEIAELNNINHSLVIHCQHRSFLCVSMHLPIDVVVAVKDTVNLSYLHHRLTMSIMSQLEQMTDCLLKYCKGSKFPTLEVYHFYPYSWDWPVEIIYPAELGDKELEQDRKNCMTDLFLNLDRPYFRKANHCLSTEETNATYLINPHVGLPSSGVEGGIVAIVHGMYTYHHYMQDHMNDDGWGCAYRSLQTIISWFIAQGYTTEKVPSHKEIQEALVAVGDKPAKFVGSIQWIGSQEVSFCLDHIIGVTSKIMFVSSGEELSSKGQELLHHFQGNGTPVMIGGGVLAHTILGVDYNLQSGELKFLVLDPHYTGAEDLNVVQKKGWCGWKSGTFWNKTAFYNLCLPQRPIMF